MNSADGTSHHRWRAPAVVTQLTLAMFLIASPITAQQAEPGPAAGATISTEPAPERLPPPSTTEHQQNFGSESLQFTATVGPVTLERPDGSPEADIVCVAFLEKRTGDGPRPVTFVVNGGPGAASAYLQLGALGPWRLPLEEEQLTPSQKVALIPNADTWLDFTDLVFIDPVGTGFSRLVEPDDALRERYLSIGGDIDALARVILQWLSENDRIGDATYFVGESYGAFRGPLLAEVLQTDYGVGLSGLILVSPVLDFAWRTQTDHAPLPQVTLLPSIAATAMEKSGDLSTATLDAVEAYAADDYLADLLRGVGDAAAVDRLVDRVSDISGLPRAFLKQSAGRLSAEAFAHEVHRDEGRVASAYDATIATAHPNSGDQRGRRADPVLDALTAPLTGAAIQQYRDQLNWIPDRRYILLNRDVNRSWDWGEALGQPEAVSALSQALALDPWLRVLVVHGYTDLVTPYFASELILRQLEGFSPGGHIKLATYRGGHMFYTRGDSRRAFFADARDLYASSDGIPRTKN